MQGGFEERRGNICEQSERVAASQKDDQPPGSGEPDATAFTSER